MAFSPPLYNLHCRWWLTGVVPFANPPAGFIDLQLYVSTKGFLDVTPGSPLLWVPPTVARIAPATLEAMKLLSLNVVGCYFEADDAFLNPWYYKVRYWEWAHLGFSNAYAMLFSDQCDSTGVIPDPGR